MKVHLVVYIVAGVFKTACGRYLDGPDKERGTALPDKVDCKNCRQRG